MALRIKLLKKWSKDPPGCFRHLPWPLFKWWLKYIYLIFRIGQKFWVNITNIHVRRAANYPWHFLMVLPASLEWQRRINIRLKIMYFIWLLYNMYSFSLFVSSVLYSEMYHMLSYYTRELIAKIGQCPGSAGLSLALCPIYTATWLGRTGLTQQL